jgi:hypothetical protein
MTIDKYFARHKLQLTPSKVAWKYLFLQKEYTSLKFRIKGKPPVSKWFPNNLVRNMITDKPVRFKNPNRF